MNEHSNQSSEPVPATTSESVPAKTSEPAKGMAIASMVCGICSLVLFFIPFANIVLAIVAVALGHIHLSNMKKFPDMYDGRGMAVAGLATGYVFLGFTILGFIILLATGSAILGSL
tara:strand:+ start:71 stop:418 length:348 start_codon:yes stop_codon:yes gene_type:complete